MTQSLTTQLIDGDFAEFWVVSTDRAGNPVNGLAAKHSQRGSTLESWSSPTPTNTVFDPTDKPLPGQRVMMKTFWSNLGKRRDPIFVPLGEQGWGRVGPIPPQIM